MLTLVPPHGLKRVYLFECQVQIYMHSHMMNNVLLFFVLTEAYRWPLSCQTGMEWCTEIDVLFSCSYPFTHLHLLFGIAGILSRYTVVDTHDWYVQMRVSLCVMKQIHCTTVCHFFWICVLSSQFCTVSAHVLKCAAFSSSRLPLFVDWSRT